MQLTSNLSGTRNMGQSLVYLCETYSILFLVGSGATAPNPLTLCFPAGNLSAL